MTDEEVVLLQSVLTAQVVLLARQMKAEDKAKGITSGGYLREAWKSLEQARPEVLRLLAGTAAT